MKEKEDFWTKHSVTIAFSLVGLGVCVIIYFICSSPFNDWSGEMDSDLFSSFGDFIGGFIGTIFSLSGFLLLYKTLLAQQESIKKQEDSLDVQKKSIEQERFENTFFNLLNNQQNITNNIKADFRTVNDVTNECTYTIVGREFFRYAKNELHKINNSIFSSSYIGMYDDSYAEHMEYMISEMYNPNSPDYTHPDHADAQADSMKQMAQIQYANKFYNITSIHWNQISKKEKIVKIKYMYYFLFRRFDYTIGHYFRNLYHILKFIKKYEDGRKVGSQVVDRAVYDDCRKYAQFIQAQMSAHELLLLYYNALCFPKMFELVKHYNVLENLTEDYLIDSSHVVDDIKLKKRGDLFNM